MKRIFLASMLLATPAIAQQPEVPPSRLKAMAEQMQTAVFSGLYSAERPVPDCHDWRTRPDAGCNIIIGQYAGWGMGRDARGNLLIGDYTTTPTTGTQGFVNIANKLCFWRDSGEQVACPPPVPALTEDGWFIAGSYGYLVEGDR